MYMYMYIYIYMRIHFGRSGKVIAWHIDGKVTSSEITQVFENHFQKPLELEDNRRICIEDRTCLLNEATPQYNSVSN
jgi:hypothetical protein